MSLFDNKEWVETVVRHYQGLSGFNFSGGSFSDALLKAFWLADKDNRERLSHSFPVLAEVYKDWFEGRLK